jgi:glycosyltransferase involved in cell wall biosynthesis
VIAGKPDDVDYVAKINQLIAENQLQDRVLLAGAISDEAKYWLYQHCEAFAFPSLLEGFGMPIIEAFSVGKPEFASALTSMPEVGGELTHYWHNFEPAHMAQIFTEGRQAMSQDTQFAQKAQARAQLFTWEQAGKRYASLYEQILKNA